MFKNKNAITKISNGFLIAIFALSSISLISLSKDLFFGVNTIEGYTQADYMFNFVVMILFTLFSAIWLIVLNKKLDLYDDKYPLSRKLFNFLLAFGILGVVINIGGFFATYFIYKEFSLMTIIGLCIELPIYVIAYFYLENHEILNHENSKKINFVNFIAFYMFIEYISNIIFILLKIIFNDGKLNQNLKSIGISIGMVVLVLIAYKIINKTNNINTLQSEKTVIPTKEVVILKEAKKKKKK